MLSHQERKTTSAKIAGRTPKNFTATVKTKLLNGDEVSVEMKYTYRTRSEFGAFLDEIFAENEVKPADNSEQPLPPRCSRHTRPALSATQIRSCVLPKAGTWTKNSAAKNNRLFV